MSDKRTKTPSTNGMPGAEAISAKSSPFRKTLALHAALLLIQILALSFFFSAAPVGSISPEMELERILALPDAELERVDIARINLLAAKEVFPDLDVDTYLAKLDRLAREIVAEAPRYPNYRQNPNDPNAKLSVLCTELHQERKFQYTRYGQSSDPRSLHRDPKNLFLNGVLDRMMGTCISMPILYIALGERLGYPIRGVNANDHFFCRWDDGTFVTNIEPTGGGGWSSDEDYVKDLGVTQRQIESGAYMRTLTKRQVIGNFFLARAAYFDTALKDRDKAIRDLLKAVACNSRDVDSYANLAHQFAKKASLLGKDVELARPEAPDPQVERFVQSEIERLQAEAMRPRPPAFFPPPVTQGGRGPNRFDPLQRPDYPLTPNPQDLVPNPATYGIRR